MRTTTSYGLSRMTGLYVGELVKVTDASPAQIWSWDGKTWVNTGLTA